jgi:hypothetical protein
MRCLAFALLCAPLVLPASLAAQAPAHQTAGGRLSVRAVAGYSFGYRREFGGEDERPRPGPAPGAPVPTTQAWNVEGKPVLGAEVEYRITEAFVVRGGVLHRPQAQAETCSGGTVLEGPGGPIALACPRGLILERALWMTKLGVAWSPSEHLPLSLSFSPLWVRQADPFGDGAADHWGVSLGAGAEVRLGDSRAALHAALEDDVVFWRTAPGAPDAKASHLVVLRAGVAYRP